LASAFVGFAFLGGYKPLDKPLDDKPAKCRTALNLNIINI